MQNHTFEPTRALDETGVAQTVVTTRPPGARGFERVGSLARVHRVGLPIRHFRQLYSLPATRLVPRLAIDADLIHVHLGEDLAVIPLGMRRGEAACLSSCQFTAVFATNFGCRIPGPPCSRRSGLLVRAAHALDLCVYPYTVNEISEMCRLIDLGVDGVVTDLPERLYSLLRSRTRSAPVAASL